MNSAIEPLAANAVDGSERKPVALALQGGGSWGAYTWGVLDAFLTSRRVRISQLSGTSAGAINAAIVAGALAGGSPALARKRLRGFWMDVARQSGADLPDALWAPVERHLRETVGSWLLASGAYSPYHGNPLGFNPLREIIAAHVDLEAVRQPDAPPLFITLTEVRTGLPRVIDNAAMSLDALLASACLPQLFQAVELDGEPYWDGGYCGNPSLWPMLRGQPPGDLIVVQLAPDRVDALPVDGVAIRRRVGEIVFHASLVAEMRAIETMRASAGDGMNGVHTLRLHRVGPPATALADEGSALDRSRRWIERLFYAGRKDARRFLARHADDLGVRETLDIASVFASRGDTGAAAVAAAADA